MDLYYDIIEHFGLRNQLKKLTEENHEFVESVIDFDNNADTRDHIVEEMGDMLILLTEFIAYYKIDKSELDKVMDAKLKRTIERIASDYYVKNDYSK